MEDIQSKAKIDLNNRLAITKNSLDIEKVKKENKNEEDFWSRERKRMQADPNNVGYQTAIAVGKVNAKAFVNSALDPNDKDHEKNWPVFKSVYNLSADTVERDMIAAEAEANKTGPFQFKDDNYERKIKARYKKTPTTSLIEAKLFDNFCAALDAKWAKSGYSKDKSFISSHCLKYGIEPNMAIDELAKFEPKD